MGYGLDGQGIGVRFPAGARDFSLLRSIESSCEVRPAYWVSGAISLGIKWLGFEADPSPPSSTTFKNVWNFTSITLYVFIAWCLVKHKDNSVSSVLKKNTNYLCVNWLLCQGVHRIFWRWWPSNAFQT